MFFQSLSWYLATRYLHIKSSNHSIRTMGIIAFISIFMSTGALALVTAIMHGFHITIQEKMQNIHPQAILYSYKYPIAFDSLKKVLLEEYPSIQAVSPYRMGHVMIQSPVSEQEDIPYVALLKGVDPDAEQSVSTIATKITGCADLTCLNQERNIIIGATMADALNVTYGDVVTLSFIEPPKEKQKKVSVQQYKATVAGIINTGIDEYDATLIYCSLPFFEHIFPDQGVTQVGLAFASPPTQYLLSELKERTGFEILTWQESYKPLLSALILEKYAMVAILLLITIVASMNIIALLFMITTYKQKDIAVLRSMGMPYHQIRATFIILGMIIAATAILAGLIVAYGIAWSIEYYQLISLPDVYYVSYLPARMELSIIMGVAGMSLCIAYGASWFAVQRIKSIKISSLLRQEG